MSDGWIRTHFHRTPRMSTYLLAFVVCNFDFASSYTDTDPSIQVGLPKCK